MSPSADHSRKRFAFRRSRQRVELNRSTLAFWVGHAAEVARVVETCKLNGVEPHAYFTNLLTRLVHGWPNARIDELMPWSWTKSAASSPSSG